MSICSSLGNKYQVKLDRIDKAPLLVGLKLRGMSDTILVGSSHLKFGTGQHCGSPDPCIEFAPKCSTQWLGATAPPTSTKFEKSKAASFFRR